MKIVFYILIFIPQLIFAQMQKVDSLKNNFNHCTNDSCKAQVVKKIFWVLVKDNPDSAKTYMNKYLSYFKKSKYEMGIVFTSQALAEIERRDYNFKKTIDILNDAYSIVHGDDERVILLLTLAEDNRKLENFEMSEQNLKDAINLTEKDNLYFISKEYSRLSACYYEMNKLDKSLIYSDSSIFYAKKINHTKVIASSYEIKGATYQAQKKIKKAIQFYVKALEINKDNKDTSSLANNYSNLGISYFSLKKYDTAIDYLEKSCKMNSTLNLRYNLLNSLAFLAQAYAGEKDFKKAYFIEDSVMSLRVSLFDEEKSNKILELNKKFDSERKDIQLNEQKENLKNTNIILKQEKFQKFGAFFIVLLLFVFSVLSFFVRRKAKFKNEILEQNKNSLYVLNQKLFVNNLKLEEQNNKIVRDQKILKEKNKDLKEKNEEITIQKDLYDTLSDKYYKNFEKSKEQNSLIKFQNKELEEVNKKIKKLSKFRELHTQMIVHDLKNPLNRIISIVKDNEQLKDTSRYMLNLVENILFISKIEKNIFKVDIQQIDIIQVVSQAYEATEFLFLNKGIEYVNYIKDVIIVLGDFEILKRVFINLFTNATKFTKSGGKIFVKYEIVEDEFFIEIKDTGIGIKQEKLAEIFKLYKTSENSVKKDVKSTGIGLYFVQKSIEAHNSNIEVISKKGVGTSFVFPLKLVKEIRNKVKYNLLQNNKTIIILTETEKQELQIILKQLKKTKIYEVSEIRNILSNIQVNSDNINNWLSLINKSVDNYNVKLFNKLLDI